MTEERRPVRLSIGGISRDFERLRERAGVSVPDAMHMFRRTFACGVVRQKKSRTVACAVAGWSTTAMLDYYTEGMAEEEEALEEYRTFNPFR